jgi:hypothetical protein
MRYALSWDIGNTTAVFVITQKSADLFLQFHACVPIGQSVRSASEMWTCPWLYSFPGVVVLKLYVWIL